MTTFTVDTLSDDPDDGLTLREALALADDEAANAGADRIEFASAIQGGKITLAGSELTVDSDVGIDGGTGVTIDANQLSRVLLIGAGTLADVHDVTLTSLTVTGGKTTADFAGGGGIKAEGYTGLSLSNSTVSGNSTAGETAFGGGIYGVDVTLTNSTVSGNSTTGPSSLGGGLIALKLTLTSSTVSGNSTTGSGSYGGGIYANNLTLTNSTVSGNSTTGEQADGGGIHIAASGDLKNSIIAGNSATDGKPDIGGVIITSNGHNIFGSDVAGNVAGDQESVAASTVFAALDPATGGGLLANNGGPTKTIALLDDPANPALGTGEDLGSTSDQRGETRPAPAGTNPDIGAFELAQTGTGGGEIVGTHRGERLVGTTSADVIRGLGGNDNLQGRAGDDQLFGGNGDDVLFGNAGLDRVTGGNGADRFVLRAAGEAAPDGPAYEEFLGFNRSQGDKIDLRTIDANEDTAGNQAFAFIGGGPLTGPAQLHAEAFDGDFLVTGNVDADPEADFAFIVRSGLASLRASDFLL